MRAMRTIQVHTFVKYRVRAAICAMLVAKFSDKTHEGGTYIHRDPDATPIETDQISVDVSSTGGYAGKYTGLYGEWSFTADVPNMVKVKPVDAKAKDYHETKHTITMN